MPKTQSSYAKFKAILNSAQQLPGKVSPDFRDDLLRDRFLNWRVGFRKQNLATGFSANLTSLYPSLSSFEDSSQTDWVGSLLYGAIVEDDAYSHKSALNIVPLIEPSERVIFFEMGFLASAYSWSESLQKREPQMACLGYVFDDKAQYYMADYVSRLNEKLNSAEELGEQERQRVKTLIDRIVSKKVSKYNSQPIVDASAYLNPKYSKRVLVCDQNFADASTLYGKAGASDFAAMLDAALSENPDAEIVVKLHPDTVWEKAKTRVGFFQDLKGDDRITLIREPMNPFCLFELVDKVYVATSGMGFEALLAGKEVVCFGAPFYAGWGFTDDRKAIPHRRRKRTVTDVFHYFYIWYTVYNLPGTQGPREIEEALGFIERYRPAYESHATDALSVPDVSIVVPVYEVEKYLRSCVDSIRAQTLKSYEVLFIDDHGEDGSVTLCQHYVEADSRFKMLQTANNVGPGFARNYGMDRAIGRYVLFIDPDDFMPDPDHLQRIVDRADAEGADMVRFKKAFEQVEREDGSVIKRRQDISEQFFTEDFTSDGLKGHPEIWQSRHFWNWLYRRDFINENDIRFLTAFREERPFVVKSLLCAKKITSVAKPGVVYRIRPDSAVRRKQTAEDVFAQMRTFEEVVRLLKSELDLHSDDAVKFGLRFQVSQFLHYLTFGFALKTIRGIKSEALTRRFFAEMKQILALSGLTSKDLVRDPPQLSATHIEAGAYQLIFDAIMAGKPDFVDLARDREPVPQNTLYAEYLREPIDVDEHAFQLSLNTYCRNDRVASRSFSVGGGYAKHANLRIIVHTGASKTGSTYLQNHLERNRPALLRRGIWYPEVGLFWQRPRPHKQAGHSGFLAAMRKGNAKLVNHLENGLSILGSNVHTIILSSEAFFLNEDAPSLRKYLSAFPVVMSIYLRRQDDWANSQYCEFVAGGALGRTAQTVEEWLGNPITVKRLNYESYLERWRAAVGIENMLVRPYERDRLVNQDLLSDFAANFDLPQLLDLPRPQDVEANIFPFDEGQVELMREYNTLPFSHSDAYLTFVEAVTRGIAGLEGQSGGKGVNLLTEEQRRTILAEYADMNKRIARRYGIGDVLFHETKMSASKSSKPVSAPAQDIFRLSYMAHSGIKETLTELKERADRSSRPRPAEARSWPKGRPAERSKTKRARPADSDIGILTTHARWIRRKAHASPAMQELLDIVMLMRSDLYDQQFYEKAAFGRKRNRVSSIRHFLRDGCSEGIDPSKGFDVSAYYEKNSDVAEAGMNALVHYLRHGRREGRPR